MAAAAVLLEEMEASTVGSRRLDSCLFHYFSAWCHMLGNDVLSAYQQQKKALNLALEVGIPFIEPSARPGAL